MSRYAPLQRAALADALEAVEPAAPTLCAGWTAADLAAHVVVRDRRPDAAPGIMLKPLAGWTESVRRGERDSHPYPEQVERVRRGPWMRLNVVDDAFNTLEFFVHTEDVRRAQPEWQPRPLDDDLARYLWSRVRGLVRFNLRRFPAAVRVVAPGHGEVTSGNGEPAVTVTGDPGELVLFFFGRQRATRVEVTGDDTLVNKLNAARLGV
jgi:uncharacterized protein (TIGR03085 family)